MISEVVETPHGVQVTRHAQSDPPRRPYVLSIKSPRLPGVTMNLSRYEAFELMSTLRGFFMEESQVE